MNRPEIVDKIRHVMHEEFPEAVTILYGSEARGEAHPDSDFDLLILLPDEFDNRTMAIMRSQVIGRLYDIMLDDTVDISPLILQPKIWNERKTPFTINVTNDGILL